MSSGTPLRNTAIPMAKIGSAVDETAMAEAAAELPVPPARDHVGVRRPERERPAERRRGPNLPTREPERAPRIRQQERRPEEHALLNAEEHAEEMRRCEVEAEIAVRAHEDVSCGPVIDDELWRDHARAVNGDDRDEPHMTNEKHCTVANVLAALSIPYSGRNTRKSALV